ncbi:hypothetical protein QJS66_05995 [Kocuria rhizophila]|nr:hypothetical protein QJS66_05995 [Kocuria rhizophila]
MVAERHRRVQGQRRDQLPADRATRRSSPRRPREEVALPPWGCELLSAGGAPGLLRTLERDNCALPPSSSA